MTAGVLFVENYLAGGSDQVARELAQRLPFTSLTIMINRGNDTSILLADDLPSHVVVKSYGLVSIPEMLSFVKSQRSKWFRIILWVMVHLLRYPYFLFSIIYFFLLTARMKVNVFVVNNGGYPGGDFCRSASIAASLLPSVRVFHIVHSMAASPSVWVVPLEWLIDRIIDSRCRFITICRATADHLKSQRRIMQNVKTIYNGLEKISLSDFSKGGEKFNILNVGYFDHNKNQAMLIRAVAELAKRGYNNVHVHFLGNETEDHQAEFCRVLAIELNVTSMIHFEGFVTDTLSWYRACDLFVLCSFSEGLPMSIIEAMRVGRPVLATRVGGVPEMVDEGVNGFVVSSGDYICLANQIELFMLDNEMLDRFGIASKELFEEKFTVDIMMSEYARTFGLEAGHDFV